MEWFSKLFGPPKKPDDPQGSEESSNSAGLEKKHERKKAQDAPPTPFEVSHAIAELTEAIKTLISNGIPAPVGAETLVLQKPEALKPHALKDLSGKVALAKSAADNYLMQLEARKAVEGLGGCVLCAKAPVTLDFSHGLGALFGVGRPQARAMAWS